MGKHTPGPWVWKKCDWWTKEGGYADLVSYVPGETFPSGSPKYFNIIDDGSAGGEYSPTIDVDGPDAALIAAAPDLLAACEATERLIAANEQIGQTLPAAERWLLQVVHAVIAKAKGEQ